MQLVAEFDAPGAREAFATWRDEMRDALAAVPDEALRVDTGRGGNGAFVCVWVAGEFRDLVSEMR